MLVRAVLINLLLLSVMASASKAKEKLPGKEEKKKKQDSLTNDTSIDQETINYYRRLSPGSIDAIVSRDLEKIRPLVGKTFNINDRTGWGGKGATPLHLVMYSSRDIADKDYMKNLQVSSQDFIKLLEYLLDKGADMNARSGGETPLMRCKGPKGSWGSDVSSQYYKYFSGDLKTLMSSPCADAITVFAKRPEFKIENTRSEDKWVSGWMLGVLAEVNHLETIKFLVEKKGLKINKDILSYISRRTSKKTLEYLFKKGSGIELNPRSYRPYEWEHVNRDSVLSYLIDTGAPGRVFGSMHGYPSSRELSDPKIIKLLKERGEYVDVNETIKFIIEKGIDVKGSKKENLLDYVVCSDIFSPKVARKIVESGGVSSVEKYRFLHRFYKSKLSCSKEIFNLLKEGLTPLHMASVGHDLKEVKSLIAKGTDINVQTKDGSTPLHLAIIISIKGAKLFKVPRFLINKRADINIKNKAGKTPLHLAVIASIEGYKNRTTEGALFKILELLTIAGADINIEDKAGKSPLSYTIDENAKYCGAGGSGYIGRDLAVMEVLIRNGKKVSHKFLSLLRKASRREREWRIKIGDDIHNLHGTRCSGVIRRIVGPPPKNMTPWWGE